MPSLKLTVVGVGELREEMAFFIHANLTYLWSFESDGARSI